MKHVTRNTNRSHRSGKKDRRAARVRISLVLACALGVLLAWVGVWHEVLPWNPQSGGVALAEAPATDDPETVYSEGEDPTGGGPGPPVGTEIPDAQPGAPRPWEMGLNVSPYSTVNVLHRNVLTVMPIVNWSGVGPDMRMNLYHNSATVDATIDTTRGMGFDVGPGWTTSFSAHLFEAGTNDRIVVADDGTRDLYTWKISTWMAPPGVRSALSFDAAGSTYTLKYKDQSFDTFDADGLLIAVSDAFGNQITIQRVDERIDTVTDASGRPLQFVYVGSQLDRIIDPKEDSHSNTLITLQQREWTFAYDAQGRVSAVTDPMALLNDFQYDAAGHIIQIRDKYDPNDQNTPVPGWYVFEYEGLLTIDTNALRNVTDPLNTQRHFHVGGDGGFSFHVDYTDRRGNKWVYESWQGLPEALIESPPVAAIVNPLDERTSFHYDGDRNAMRSTDALGNVWKFSYDGNGNRLSVASPLHDPPTFDHKQLWAYDEYPVGDPLEGQIFNNPTSYTDAEGNVTTYHYAEVGFPTLLTSTVAPETVVGEGTATTRFEYFIAPYSTPTCDPTGEPGNNECKHGQLERMTDPNNVVTSFEYDRWGQMHYYREGQVAGIPVFEMRTETDSGSRTFIVERGAGGGSRCGGSGGRTRFNQNNHPTAVLCLPQVPGCSSRAVTAPMPPFCTPDLAEYVTSGDWHATFDPMCRNKHMEIDLTFERFGPEFTRSLDSQYDPLGALVNTVSDTEENDGPQRQFDYPYDLTTGIFTRVGPDLVETVTTLDEANRVESVVRRLPSGGGSLMEAFYDYYADGRVHFVTFLNGAKTEYSYDAAGRVKVIDHRNDLEITLLKLIYDYNKRGFPTTVTEVDALNFETITNFTYDNRGRLTDETRNGTAPYNLHYEYDKGGNRTLKVDAVNGRRDEYTYDREDPLFYESDNNRLMSVETLSTGGPEELISTTYYTYSVFGNVTRVTTERVNPEPGERKFTATRFIYARNGETVSYVIGEAWDDQIAGVTCEENYEIVYAREFRYHSARARYLIRELDTAQLELGNVVALSEIWSDYDGDSIYGDFTLDGPTLSQTAIYQPGIGRSRFPTMDFGTEYYHGNAIGSTRLMTDSPGLEIPPNVASESSYTAFGEQIGGASQRFGYAGAHGYQTDESGDGFPFMHVGARYYDPATGRFLQRDPIGIAGGFNVYSYVENNPTSTVDPSGLMTITITVGVEGKVSIPGVASVAITVSVSATGNEEETAAMMEIATDIAEKVLDDLKEKIKKKIEDELDENRPKRKNAPPSGLCVPTFLFGHYKPMIPFF